MIRDSQPEQRLTKAEKVVACLSSDDNSAVRIDIDKTQTSGQNTTGSQIVLSSAEDVQKSQGRDLGSTDMEVLQDLDYKKIERRMGDDTDNAGSCQGRIAQ